jgi:hypothetical protein
VIEKRSDSNRGPRVRGVRLLEVLLQGLPYALRVLTKSPAFILLSVLSPALGIDVNETLARRLAPGGQAFGRRLIEREPMTGRPKPLEVVGVTMDARYICPSERSRYLAYRPTPYQFNTGRFCAKFLLSPRPGGGKIRGGDLERERCGFYIPIT